MWNTKLRFLSAIKISTFKKEYINAFINHDCFLPDYYKISMLYKSHKDYLLSVLEDKNKDAEEIIERHKSNVYLAKRLIFNDGDEKINTFNKFF